MASTDLRTAAQQALEAMSSFESGTNRLYEGEFAEEIAALRAALEADDGMYGAKALTKAYENGWNAAKAEPVQEPVAWSHNFISDNIITHRPADIDRHPDRWTALYPEPKPCPTCEALARTVMMDQTGYDTAPPQRKPLTDEKVCDLWSWSMTAEAERTATTQQHAFARAIERAHGIGSQP